MKLWLENALKNDIFFRCFSNTDRENLPLKYQFQCGRFSVMFWGCFSSFGLGPLVALDGSLNQWGYIDLLRDFLIPEIEAAKFLYNVDLILMQSNAPCHKTLNIMNYLASKNVETLKWPPQSPDLNPIENLWALIKRKWQSKYGMSKTKQEFVEQIFEIWDNTPML